MSERILQQELKKFLIAARRTPIEGGEVGGGESDLICEGFVIENKVRGKTASPAAAGADYEWQERRYSLAINSSIGIVCVGYLPANESALVPQWKRLMITSPETTENRVHVRLLVPYGHPRPSHARAPLIN